MKAYVDQLERLTAREHGQPVIANQYFQWFGFGVMDQVAFFKDFSMLRDTQWRSAIRVICDGLTLLGPLIAVSWLMIWGSDTAVVNLKTMVGLLLSLFLCHIGIQLVVQAERNFWPSKRSKNMFLIPSIIPTQIES